MAETSGSDDASGLTADSVSIHAVARLSVVVFGVTSAASGGWDAWTTGVDFAVAGSLGGGLVVAVCGLVMLTDGSDRLGGLLGTLTVVGVLTYLVGVVW